MYFASQAVPPEDFTFGTKYLLPPYAGPVIGNPASVNYDMTNSEVIGILMDLTAYRNGVPTANVEHLRNPQQIKFLTARTGELNRPGLGPDGIYRDPWANPYIISIDLNYDEKCWDAFYRRMVVTQKSGAEGFVGLNNSTDGSGAGDHFAFNGGVMVWSLGPDGKADATLPAQDVVRSGLPVKAGVNADNVLSWR
jgi:hypothetical protein